MNGRRIRGFDVKWQMFAPKAVFGLLDFRQAVGLSLLVLVVGGLSQCVVVSGFSMEPTLVQGDWLFLNKLTVVRQRDTGSWLSLEHHVRRGDILVFDRTPLKRELYVKRVIGLPGDHVRIVNGEVYLNGQHLIEPYIKHGEITPTDYRENFPRKPDGPVSIQALVMLEQHVRGNEVIVPSCDLFVLGDNRENSIDSRYWGFASARNVVGVPVLILWSYDTNACLSTVDDKGGCMWRGIRWQRFFRLIRSADSGRRR